MTKAARYTTVAIALHWAIAAMILAQIAGGLYMTSLPDASAKFEIYQLHKSFGIVVLLLSLFRLGWRLANPAPPLPEGMSGLERAAARLTHVGFYALMIGTPLLGWAYASAAPFNVPTVLFGVVPLPHLPFLRGFEDQKAAAEAISGLHEFAAFAIVGLLLLHIGAALKHHFISRDDVLARMLPFIRVRSK